MHHPRQLKETEKKIKCLNYNFEVSNKENKVKQDMSEIEKAFYPFGFTKNEIKVYLCLATTGVLKACDISEKLSIHRTETYRLLKTLENRGLLSVKLEKPLKFKAVPFSESYDILIKTQKLNLLSLKNKKKELIEKWKEIPKIVTESRETDEVFQVIEGDERIILKINQISENAHGQIFILMPDVELYRLYRSQFIENIERHSGNKLKISLITNSSSKSRAIVEKMNLKNVKFVFSETQDLPSFIIKDQKEVLMSMEKSKIQQNQDKEQNPTYLLTNYYSIIKSMNLLFNAIWTSNPPTSSNEFLKLGINSL
ncbi:MAG: helix-turn-helix domain-containing protein [Candidatus Bathyarchaeota archaeon]|nr:helix-turn-helix domain-containing protein [Candidatus Bathyarchaeum tardum]WGM89030.1 MAG: helix-turn-helix domain-containing protein [Candidatus Bathyarchaeum tardum]